MKHNEYQFAIAIGLDPRKLQPLDMSMDDALLAIKTELNNQKVWPYNLSLSGDVYLMPGTSNVVDCILAAQSLGRRLPWLKSAILSFQMLRISEITDLSTAFVEGQ